MGIGTCPGVAAAATIADMDSTTTVAGATAGHAARRLAKRLAWAAAVLMLVVTTASAWLRLAQPRTDCAEWPLCRTGLHSAAAPPAAGSGGVLAAGVAPARALHRVAATSVLLLAVWLVVSSSKAGANLQPIRRPSRGLLGTALALAALGLAGGASRSAFVMLANQAGGFVMLGLTWVIVRRLRAGAAPSATAPRPQVLLALAWLLQAGLGAASGAGTLAAAPLHLAAAAIVWPLALLGALQAMKRGAAAEGRALQAVLLLQLLAGGTAAAYGAPPPLVLVHNVLAAVGFALVAGLADAARGLKAQAQV